jgi:hypothetical protein
MAIFWISYVVSLILLFVLIGVSLRRDWHKRISDWAGSIFVYVLIFVPIYAVVPTHQIDEVDITNKVDIIRYVDKVVVIYEDRAKVYTDSTMVNFELEAYAITLESGYGYEHIELEVRATDEPLEAK